jgi:hypothetical protein
MKSTLVALFGVIAMACASHHPNQESPTRHNQLPPSIPVDIAKEFKERNQVKKDVELNTQEILKGLPFAGKYLSGMKISTSKTSLRQVPRLWLME